MKRVFSPLVFLLLFVSASHAQMAPDAAELTKLLNDFLAGASVGDPGVHDRFWADDLIYTRSAGRRIGKADVLRDVRSAPAPKPGDPRTVYSAEDIRIQQYATTAVVAFRLVGTTKTGGKIETSNFLNTGVFLKRDGRWQVVSWQSTRMPRPQEEASKELAAAETDFNHALFAADTKTLERLMDESFIWTHDNGEQVTRQQLLERLGSGRLKYSKRETNNVTVSVYGDSGVLRGVALLQRTSIPRSGSSGTTSDPSPVTAFYTLTFINQGGGWKAVAMHSSRQ